ncbi:MAG: GTPase Era [Spirochaetales bacterium]
MHEQTDRTKSAIVTIIGRPSVGKSTLINRICGHKISIVTPTPQTTRNRIRGIVTEARGQLVFVDTPGYHNSEKKFNLAMRSLVTEELEDSDIILVVIDMSRDGGEEEQALIDLVAGSREKTIVAMNKSDTPLRSPVDLTAALEPLVRESIAVSATTGDGIPALTDALFEAAPEGPAMYPEEFYTDQEPTFRIAEIVREHAMLRTKQELPHALYVDVSDIAADPSGRSLNARAIIYVERESQKGIVVGRGAQMIKEIRVSSEKDLSDIFERRVKLDLRVKVHPKWRQRDRTIGKLVR